MTIRTIIKKLMCFYDEDLRWDRRQFDVGDGVRLGQAVKDIQAIRHKEAISEGEIESILEHQIYTKEGDLLGFTVATKAISDQIHARIDEEKE